MSNDDRAILEALAGGDPGRALTLRMEQHGEEVYRLCLAMVGPELAGDAHQITFVQAFRDLERFKGRSSVRTWLLAIARHRCLDALRLERRRQRKREAIRPDAHASFQPVLAEVVDCQRRIQAPSSALA